MTTSNWNLHRRRSATTDGRQDYRYTAYCGAQYANMNRMLTDDDFKVHAEDEEGLRQRLCTACLDSLGT